MQRVEIDVKTGEKRIIDFSAEEILKIEAAAIESQRNVPQEVTRFQALSTLHLSGTLEAVEAMMADPATDRLTVLAWQNAQVFKRYSPMVLSMAQALGLSEQQLDELFVAAAKIE